MKEYYYQLYSVVSSLPGKVLRLLAIIVVFVILVSRIINQADILLTLAIFTALIIIELFFEQLKFTIPENKVGEESKDQIGSATFPARQKITRSKAGYDLAIQLSSEKSIKFFCKELGIGKIEKYDVKVDEMIQQAKELVEWIHGNYITQIDLFASYILLTEDESRFLSKNKLNNDDVINVVYWTRKKFIPDSFSKHKIAFSGVGVFDSLCYGWNYELKKYAIELTSEVLSRKFTPYITGQEKEYEELKVALSKRRESNAILIGESGVGKKNLIEHLAKDLIYGHPPGELVGKKVFELMVDRLIAGVANSGELESRLGQLLEEIANSGNCIVFIQNIENIFGGGGFNFDISGVLDQYIESEKIKFVGSTTPGAFANFIQHKTNVVNLFEKIEISEMDDKKTLQLLCDKADEISSKYGVNIQYQALKESVLLAPIFYPDRFAPGRAINLIEEVSSRNHVNKKPNVTGADVTSFVQEKTNVVLAEPDEKEKELLSHLDDKLHERVIGQKMAVDSVAAAIKRLRSGFKNGHRPIAVFLFLGPTGVGKTELAKALAREYFAAPAGGQGSEERMIRLDMSEYQTQDQIDRLLGAKSGDAYQPNTLLEQVENQPFSLVLLDEFEKADHKLLNLFLQVFDEGRLTDNQGKTVSFENTIIIATSNAGAEYIREKISEGGKLDQKELLDYLLSNNIFTPELINRFDEAIMFTPLSEEEIVKVSQILLSESLKSLSDNGIEITPDEKASEKIAKESFSAEFGARNIRRFIQDNVEGYLSNLVLSGVLQRGDKKRLSVDGEGNWNLNDVSSPT